MISVVLTVFTPSADFGRSGLLWAYAANERGLKFSEGSCQSGPLHSTFLLFLSDLDNNESNPRMCCGLSLCTGECTRAARLVKSRALRLAFGKKEVQGGGEQVRREVVEDRRGSQSFGTAGAVDNCGSMCDA